jgi:hypothetical protein
MKSYVAVLYWPLRIQTWVGHSAVVQRGTGRRLSNSAYGENPILPCTFPCLFHPMSSLPTVRDVSQAPWCGRWGTRVGRIWKAETAVETWRGEWFIRVVTGDGGNVSHKLIWCQCLLERLSGEWFPSTPTQLIWTAYRLLALKWKLYYVCSYLTRLRWRFFGCKLACCLHQGVSITVTQTRVKNFFVSRF